MTVTPLTGRVVAVTGGARGIGREIASQLTQAGARVAIGDRDGAGARRTAAEMTGTAQGFDLDVADRDSFAAFLRAVEALWGPLDVLVNNAGVMWVGPFDAEPESARRRQFDVNVHGVVNGVTLAAPAMRERGAGHIVTVASAASKLSPPGESTYAATKHAVLGYLTGVRAELRRSGVHLSVVMPAVVNTELAVGTATGAAAMLQPEDVARAVVAVIERPRFEVTVPGYLGPLVRAVNVLPRPVRDLVFRAMVPDQVEAVRDTTARTDYERRVLGTDTSTDTDPSGNDK
ncbi:SDR family oxidoreductase [Rhodococcus spelaei]|uniref:SDR family oxidoreductase n=1 Tax=Rhodococcus spelaei TaxID=2546320 RepID=A0A541BNU6_9NOCA|nr:SDR family oxidoreductase [Rhodococcus spelaei]TQF74011.1 SDR family oxidoreductase [Rhodococcus spelaei]